MTQLLEKAFKEASKLPDLEQNRLARWLLAEQKWDTLFAESEDVLAGLADEALSEYTHSKSDGTRLIML